MNWNRNTYVGFWVHRDAEKQIAAVINKLLWNGSDRRVQGIKLNVHGEPKCKMYSDIL